MPTPLHQLAPALWHRPFEHQPLLATQALTLRFRRGMSARAWLVLRQRVGFSPLRTKSWSLQLTTTGCPTISSMGMGRSLRDDSELCMSWHQGVFAGARG